MIIYCHVYVCFHPLLSLSLQLNCDYFFFYFSFILWDHFATADRFATLNENCSKVCDPFATSIVNFATIIISVENFATVIFGCKFCSQMYVFLVVEFVFSSNFVFQAFVKLSSEPSDYSFPLGLGNISSHVDTIILIFLSNL